MKPLKQQFFDRLKLRGLAERTISNYMDIVHRLTLHYMRNPLDLSAEQIEAYRLFLLNERKLAPATVNLNMECLRTFYNLMKPGNTPADILPDESSQIAAGRAFTRGSGKTDRGGNQFKAPVRSHVVILVRTASERMHRPQTGPISKAPG